MQRIGIAPGLVACLLAARVDAFPAEMINDAGPGAKRINTIIVGDGFRDSDQAALTTQGKAVWDTMRSYASYGNYAAFLNVKLIHAVSSDYGARGGDHPPSSPTIFDGYFGCGGIDRLPCLGNETALWQVIRESAPEYDPSHDLLIVLLNDTKYGGGTGTYVIFSVGAGPSIAVHESGHAFAALDDEYSSSGGGACGADCPGPNTTTIADPTQIKWRLWIEPGTPVPTPEGSVPPQTIGLFEGAHYMPTGAYRPRQNCVMRQGDTTFCAPCGEALVLGLYAKTDPIETPIPEDTAVKIGPSGCVRLSYDGPKPNPNTLESIWTIDTAAAGAGTSLDVSASALGQGSHTVELTVTDKTGLVRKDVNGTLTSKRSWTVAVDPSGSNQACVDGGTGGTAGVGGSAGTARSADAETAGNDPGPRGDPIDRTGCLCNLARHDRSGHAALLLVAAALALRSRRADRVRR